MCVTPQIPNEAPFCDPAASFSHLKLNRHLAVSFSPSATGSSGEFSLRTTTGIPSGQGSVLGTLRGSTARCRVGSSPSGVRLLERSCTAHVQLSQPTGWRQQLLTSEGIVAQALQQPTTRLQLAQVAQGGPVPTVSVPKVCYPVYPAVSKLLGLERSRRRCQLRGRGDTGRAATMQHTYTKGTWGGRATKKRRWGRERFRSRGCFSQALLGKEKARAGAKWGHQGQAARLARASLFRAEGRETRAGPRLHGPQGSGVYLIGKEQRQ